MLLQFDPFRELDRRSAPALPMDAVRRGETVHVQFDLPGVAADSIDVEVERNVLTVKAERAWAREEGDQVLASERRQGTFVRRLLLGDTLDGGNVVADYADGVLSLTIPVAETAKPRKVAVGSGSVEAEALEVEAA